MFGNIYDLSSSFVSLIEKYFPVEKEEISASRLPSAEREASSKPETQSEIEPDMIFRSRMYEKFLSLEQKLINDKYLNAESHWISTHKNGTTDIKRLVTFLVGLINNNYFLPNKDSQIKIFFELRYQINIGQNFEKGRRKKYIDTYNIVFNEYRF